MRVLWLCNNPTPAILLELGIPQTLVSGSWTESLCNLLMEQSDIELHYCFFSEKVPSYICGKVGRLTFHALPETRKPKHSNLVKELCRILDSVEPDVVHIFGSEYPTTYAMAVACSQSGILSATLLHVQGLVSYIARHYDVGIPVFWKFLLMPRDFLKNSAIYKQQRQFVNRGRLEKKAIRILQQVVGRTEWDKACVTQINSRIAYYKCNEVLRSSFYKKQWHISKCEKYTIFVSQGDYPVKGLHIMLAALYIVKIRYPQVRLVVGGQNPVSLQITFSSKMKRTSYAHYLLRLIKQYSLSESVFFTGRLNEKQMCEQYLNSHVFVCSSTIENSPNSLGEAMILGMPCVASYVGGIPSMIQNKVEGLLYQSDAPYMLAHSIIELFEDDELASSLGKQARLRAMKTHSEVEIAKNQMSIYKAIVMKK